MLFARWETWLEERLGQEEGGGVLQLAHQHQSMEAAMSPRAVEIPQHLSTLAIHKQAVAAFFIERLVHFWIYLSWALRRQVQARSTYMPRPGTFANCPFLLSGWSGWEENGWHLS